MREQTVSKWSGLWKDDRGRFVQIEPYETPEGLATGFFKSENPSPNPEVIEIHLAQLYRDGNHVLDESKLMERRRGTEKGWPLEG